MTLGRQWTDPLAGFTASDADVLIGQALDSRTNFFDTADVYRKGEAETLLGAALSRRRDEAIIATKVGMRLDTGLGNTGLSAHHILKSLKTIADARGVPAAATALAWLMDRPTIATAILGFTNMDQFKANLLASTIVLTADKNAGPEHYCHSADFLSSKFSDTV